MTTRNPADTGPAQLDPPPHLRGALRAAAAARVRTARIRARPESGGPAGELPAEAARDLQPPPTRLEAAESLAGTPRGMEDPRRHFARTVAAARQARFAAPAEGADAPWHLQLRHERAEASGRPPRWLSRLLAALSAQRRPARGDRVALPAPLSAAVAGSPSRPPPAGATPLHRPEPPAFAPPAAPPSADRREIKRPPPAQDWPWQPADGARASPPEKERAGSRRLAESGVESAAARSALTARWRTIPTGADDLDRRSALAAAVRAAGRRRAVLAAPSWARRLPTTTGAGGLPAPRLAALLASSLPALAHRSQASPGASDSGSAAQAAAGPRPDRGRPAARLIAIGCAIIGGFGLGIVANGGALLTGSKLGEAMLELDRGLFGRSGSAPIAAHAPEPALRPPIARPQRAPAPGSEPAGETTAASQSGVAKAEGDAGAVEGGASEHRRFSPAPRERAATPEATATGWQALYAEGHRFQLHGNLVAAADAYRRALRLNPHHPAMLYDLGYVLQMQGQSEPAMDYYRQTIALEPDHAYAHYNLGYLLQERGKSMSASRHYEVAAARLPDNPFVYYDWAWSLESAGDLAGAAALYRKAIEIDPDRRPGSDARRRLAALGVPAPPE